MEDIFEISNKELIKLNNNETEGTKEHITQKPERVKLPRKKHDIAPENKEKMLENLRKGREARKAKSNDIMKQLTELKTLIAQPKVVEPLPDKDKATISPLGRIEQPKPVQQPKPVETKPIETKPIEAKPINKPVEAVKTMVTTTLPIIKPPTVYSTFKKPIW